MRFFPPVLRGDVCSYVLCSREAWEHYSTGTWDWVGRLSFGQAYGGTDVYVFKE